eukprot:834442-Rhodomonas_salina.1
MDPRRLPQQHRHDRDSYLGHQQAEFVLRAGQGPHSVLCSKPLEPESQTLALVTVTVPRPASLPSGWFEPGHELELGLALGPRRASATSGPNTSS